MTIEAPEHAIGAAVWYWDRAQGWDAWRPAVITDRDHREGWAVYDVLPIDGQRPAVERWGYGWQIAPRVEGLPMPPAPDLSKVQP